MAILVDHRALLEPIAIVLNKDLDALSLGHTEQLAFEVA